MKIPFLSFQQVNQEIEVSTKSFFSEFFSDSYYILGKSVKAFEKKYASYSNTSYCIGVASGLDGLIISLKALDIGKGDEVIVASNAYIASIISISQVGATPILIEPDINTFNIDTNKIESKISPNTKAIMAVHLYGQPCDMSSISLIAKKHNLKIIEDCAQAHGAKWNGQIVGSYGHSNATSFYPTKNLGALGDAGAITTNNKNIANFCTKFRNYGFGARYHCVEKGLNSRLDEFHAGVLSIKLPLLDKWNQLRNKYANIYDELLNGIGDISPPYISTQAYSVRHLYVIKTAYRNPLKSFLEKKGISTIVHYPIPPHLQMAYKDLNFQKGSYPIAEELSHQVLSLPLFIGITRIQQEYVCASIAQFFKSK